MSAPGRPRDHDIDDRILAAVRDVLAEAGVEAVTVDAVARRAGVSRPTVYRRYPTRVDLLFHAGLRLATPPAAFLAPGSPIVPDTGDLHADLSVVATIAEASFAGLADAGLLRAFISALAIEPEFGPRLWAEAVGPAQVLLRQVIVNWTARGAIAPGVDADVVLDVFPAMVIYRRVLLGRALTPDDTAQLVGLVERGLRAASGGDQARAT